MGGYLLMGFLSALVAGYLFKWKILRWLLVNLILAGVLILVAGSYLSKFFEVDYTSGLGDAVVILFVVVSGNILGAILRVFLASARKAKNNVEPPE